MDDPIEVFAVIDKDRKVLRTGTDPVSAAQFAAGINGLDVIVLREGEKLSKLTAEIEQLRKAIDSAPEPQYRDPEHEQPQLRADMYRNPVPEDRRYYEWYQSIKLLQTKDSPRYVGVDLAKPGSDRTAFRCLHCGHVSDDPSMTHQCLPEQDND